MYVCSLKAAKQLGQSGPNLAHVSPRPRDYFRQFRVKVKVRVPALKMTEAGEHRRHENKPFAQSRGWVLEPVHK